jgi:hypothetical protein
MGEPSDKPSLFARVDLRKALLYLWVLGACVFAAWQVYAYLTRARWEPPQSREPATMLTKETARPVETQEDPLGFRPPPGTRRVMAHRTGLGFTNAMYLYGGDIPSGLEHYRTVLKEGGFNIRREFADKTGRCWLVFASADLRIAGTVALRNRPGDAKMVEISLTAFPGPEQR